MASLLEDPSALEEPQPDPGHDIAAEPLVDPSDVPISPDIGTTTVDITIETDDEELINLFEEIIETIRGYIMPTDPDVDMIQALRDAMVAQVHGTPWVYELFWTVQNLSYNCTVAVQYCILMAHGIDVSQDELNELAMQEGWLTENGGSIADLGRVLQHFGIETHTKVDATAEDLISELQQGHSIIIPCDVGELWADTFLEHLWEWMEDVLNMPDHVVWVTGIDMTDPDNPQVIVNDTGTFDGIGQRYPLSEFIDAWEDANFTYVATNEAPPDHDTFVEWDRFLRPDGAV